VARPVDASKLLAGARAKLDRGNANRNGRSMDDLLAAAKERGSARKGDAARLDAMLSSARAQLRAARTKD